MGPIQTVEDLIGLVRRQFWLIAVVTVIGTALAAIYAKMRPDTYESSASLQVEMPLVVDGNSTVTPVNILQTVQIIEQRLTTRDNILAMIDRHGLFADTPALPVDEKVGAMRASIRFENVIGRSGELSALVITAQSDDPDNAARIANDLAQSILDMGAEDKRATAAASFAFYQDQEGRLLEQITALEAEIAAFRDSNRTALPGMREAQQDEITRLDVTLRELDQGLAALQSEESLVQGQSNQRATDRRRLEDIRQRLAVLEAQRAPLMTRKAALEAGIGPVAEVERTLSGYERQLGLLQLQYTTNATRMAEAETAQNLIDRRQSERFSLLERAISPEHPKGSGGKTLAIAGLIGSAGLGLMLAFFTDLLKPGIRNSAQLERELNLRPIVAIPRVPLRNRKSWGQTVGAVVGGGLGGKRPALGPGRGALIVVAAVVLLVAAMSTVA